MITTRILYGLEIIGRRSTLVFVVVSSTLLVFMLVGGGCEYRVESQVKEMKPRTEKQSADLRRLEIPLQEIPNVFDAEILGVYSSGDVVSVLTRKELLESNDNGKTWNRIGPAPTIPANSSVKFFRGRFGLLIVDHGKEKLGTDGFRFAKNKWSEFFSLPDVSISDVTEFGDFGSCLVGSHKEGYFPLRISPVLRCYSETDSRDLSAELGTALLQPDSDFAQTIMPDSISSDGECLHVLSSGQLSEKCGNAPVKKTGEFPMIYDHTVFFSWSLQKSIAFETAGGVEGFGSRLAIWDRAGNSVTAIDLPSIEVTDFVQVGETDLAISGRQYNDRGVRPIIGLSNDMGQSWHLGAIPDRMRIVGGRGVASFWAYSGKRLYSISSRMLGSHSEQ